MRINRKNIYAEVKKKVRFTLFHNEFNSVSSIYYTY